jgi:aminopeptidase
VFYIKKYHEKQNKKITRRYNETLRAIRKIRKETAGSRTPGNKKEYSRLFYTTANLILNMDALERRLNSNYVRKRSLKQLRKENTDFYRELLDGNYKTSYANPAYCTSVFGEQNGPLLCYFYCFFRQYHANAHQHLVFKMEKYNRVFINVYDYIKNHVIDTATLKKLITAPQKMSKYEEFLRIFRSQFDPRFAFYRDIPEKSELSDLRYLFRYGKYISDNEIETSKFLMKYPREKIRKLSKQIVDAYITGSIKNGRDISRKTTVLLMYHIGQEILAKQLIKDLKKQGLESAVLDVQSTQPNKQYRYDHRFDEALVLDEAYSKAFIADFEKAAKACKKLYSRCSGIVFLDQFGEKMFMPEQKAGYIAFTPETQGLFQIHQNNIVQTQERYFSRRNITFTVISLPSPEIGKNFKDVFEDILEVNMLESSVYEPIQQTIIDTLDKAAYIHVKGKGKNRTDIRVMMQRIPDPRSQTNFVNCGADINIPVGEVYTSPRLRGTSGIIHFNEVFLRGLRFADLFFTIKDGYVASYGCKNFKQKKDNKKYIEENLLFPHKTLPVGEFAIGTNTLAYVVAKKHRIMNILPTIIIEKMGPHFALGDTCFSLCEDVPMYNALDKKEVIARENEKTAMRKKKVEEAYTYRHQDITLPFESINHITAVTKSRKRIDIIRNGRFVLPGTEVLNEPFKRK